MQESHIYRNATNFLFYKKEKLLHFSLKILKHIYKTKKYLVLHSCYSGNPEYSSYFRNPVYSINVACL